MSAVQCPFTKEEYERRMNHIKSIEKSCIEEQGEERARYLMPAVVSLAMNPAIKVFTPEENKKFQEKYDY